MCFLWVFFVWDFGVGFRVFFWGVCLSLPCSCCLAFFLIAVMLNLFQHLVVYNIQVSAFEAALLFSLQKSKQKAMAQSK